MGKENMFDKNEILNMLHNNTCIVKFEKKDGTIREMACSLSPQLVEEYVKKTDRVKVPNDNIVAAFDVEKKEWRSFRIDSIIQFEPIAV